MLLNGLVSQDVFDGTTFHVEGTTLKVYSPVTLGARDSERFSFSYPKLYFSIR